MPETDVTQFVLVRSRLRAIAPMAITVALRALALVYAVVLGVEGGSLVLAVILFGVTGAIGLIGVVATLIAPPATLTAEGPRMRALMVSTGLTTVPWEDVRAAWFAYYGSQRSFCVLAGTGERAFIAPIPDGPVASAAVALAVEQFSVGRVTVADTPPPRPNVGSPSFRIGGYGKARKTSLLITIVPWLVLLAALPWLTGTR